MSAIRQAIAILGICIAIAVFIYYISYYQSKNWGSNKERRSSILHKLLDGINEENIRRNLHSFTSEAHVAGTAANNRVAEKIANNWRDSGLENVHFIKYNVLLSYPNYSNPNHITIFETDTKQEIFKTTGVSPVVLPNEQNNPEAGVQFAAYSANGTVEGDIIYCHYGAIDDFEQLKKFGISIEGKIALIRYGGFFRGSKVRNAQIYGAIGVILYSDPQNFAKEGTESVYPETIHMPRFAVQRGTLKLEHGDPLTPLFPARHDLFRSRTIQEAKAAGILPSIPVLPMSYGDAYEILSRLGGQPAPKNWTGGLNVTYNLGPGFTENKLKLRLSVTSELVEREIRNVIGYIYGVKEPDEYVIIGNHFDAWAHGSVDPNSGTAVLAEVARTFAQTVHESDWRPSRTIVFCNWDAEEYGLIGSTEFVEEFANILSERAIVYLNVDLIFGNVTLAASIPTIYNAIMKTAQKIKNPNKDELNKGRKTIYDTWKINLPYNGSLFSDRPNISLPSGGSDHNSFLNEIGVPVVDVTYANANNSFYPLYHTFYETPFLNEHLFDTDNLAVHKAVAQFCAGFVRLFADAEVLPISVTTLAKKINFEYITNFKVAFKLANQNRTHTLQSADEQLYFCTQKSQEFLRTAEKFEDDLEHLKYTSTFLNSDKRLQIYSRANRRLKAIDRCFIDTKRNLGPQRHILYSLSKKNLYKPKILGSIYSKLEEFAQTQMDNRITELDNELANEISVIQYSIQCAINTLGRAI